MTPLQAEACLQSAVRLAPEHAGAGACLQSAVRLAPEHAGVLGNDASFTHTARVLAEACLQSAVRLAPEHAGVLCNYAGFLHTTRADMDGAQRLYKQAPECA
ncbi:hypothetical protein T484DRAFT_1833511 [Baffinella frigidus]|nr:hypothetical protein T484DRAFT_1833511 [Cryptophyta sp. CCMP2293]